MADYLRGALAGHAREQLVGLFLDKRNRLIRVHLSIRSLADRGGRLSPKKADLEAWRQAFAARLRERGVDAEATPRRTRGVTRKKERGPILQLRLRHQLGKASLGLVAREKLRQAAQIAFGGPVTPSVWERRTLDRQQRVRRLYLAQAKLLQTSSDPTDRALAVEVEAFVRDLQPPDSERLALARALRAANEKSRAARGPAHSKDRA